MGKFKRVARRVVRKAGALAKKRYFTGKGFGKPKIGQMVRDVQMLKTLVNAEKKRLNINDSGSTQQIGQVVGNASGHYLVDLTPNPSQGTGYNQRTGNSIKWSSSYFDLQFRQQANAVSPIRGRIYLVQVKGTPYGTVSNVMGQFIAANTFIGDQTIYDWYSQRNPDYFQDFRVIRTKTFKVQMDQYSGQSMITSVRFGMKLKNFHVRWSLDTATVSQGQIFMLIVLDNGNASGATVNTSTSNNVANTAVNTGVYYAYNIQHYYIDN